MARSEFFNPVDTAVMGGVPVPPIDELVAMQGEMTTSCGRAAVS